MSEGLDVTPRYYQPNEGSKGLTYNKIPGGPSGCFGVLGVLFFGVLGFLGVLGVWFFLCFGGLFFLGFLGFWVQSSGLKALGFRVVDGCLKGLIVFHSAFYKQGFRVL